MKRLLTIGSLLLLLISGCYEPYIGEVFEDYLPSVVIEGKLSNQEPPYYINVSMTAPADGIPDFYPIDDAVITISDDSGNMVTAGLLKKGRYIIPNWVSKPGNWYHLNVTVDGQVYNADELMPTYPKIDSFQVNYRSNFVDGSGYYFKLFIKTRIDTIQYYRAEVWNNGSMYNGYSDLLVFDDSYTINQFNWTAPYSFSIGDSVIIKLHGITENMFKYYYGLNQQTTNNFSNIQPPLLNPPSNISNNPMGYFQVSTVTSIDSVLSLKHK